MTYPGISEFDFYFVLNPKNSETSNEILRCFGFFPKALEKSKSKFDWNNEELLPETKITDNYKNTENKKYRKGFYHVLKIPKINPSFS